MPELPRTLPEPATSLLLRSEGLDEQHTIQPGKKKTMARSHQFRSSFAQVQRERNRPSAKMVPSSGLVVKLWQLGQATQCRKSAFKHQRILRYRKQW